jgi:hypothetical protein
MDDINTPALILLNRCQRLGQLTRQQYRTLRGQVLTGDTEGALRGLQKLQRRRARRDTDT